MTHSDSIQNAYRWALDTWGNKKSSVMALWCARQIQGAVEEHDKAEEAHEAIIGLIREWSAKRRRLPSLEKPVEILSMIMGVDAEERAEDVASSAVSG